MIVALHSCETPVLTTATLRNIPEDGVLQFNDGGEVVSLTHRTLSPREDSRY
jgi:hypothetical protein